MGSDLLLEFVWMEHGQKPNWKAGRARIKAIVDKIKETGEFPTDLDHFDSVEKVKECLTSDFKLLFDTWTEPDNYRDVVRLEFPPWDIIITGGESFGDSPTELFNAINDLSNSMVLDACGFNPDTPNYKKLLETTLDSVPKVLPALIGIDKVLDEMVEKRIKQ